MRRDHPRMAPLSARKPVIPGTDQAHRTAAALMREFAERTGDHRHRRRSVLVDRCVRRLQFPALDQVDCARRLIEQVHAILGRTVPTMRAPAGSAACRCATAPNIPRAAGCASANRWANAKTDVVARRRTSEWERDGQYFHYLARWMHALDQFSRRTGHADAGRWARELAQTAHRAFTYAPTAGRTQRMYWKMRIDLSRPLVDAMGQHDPLDALITYWQLRAHQPQGCVGHGPELEAELLDMAAIVAGTNLLTDDPLSLGGLLADANRLAQLLRVRPGDNPLLGLSWRGVERTGAVPGDATVRATGTNAVGVPRTRAGDRIAGGDAAVGIAGTRCGVAGCATGVAARARCARRAGAARAHDHAIRGAIVERSDERHGARMKTSTR
jgi:hypothetical protein